MKEKHWGGDGKRLWQWMMVSILGLG